MLTLADARQLSDSTAFRDVSWVDGARTETSTFYVLRNVPALAGDYSFFWYRGAAGAGANGGLLTVTVTPSALPGDLDRLTAEIRTAFALAPDAAVSIAPVPVSSGTVSLSFAGESAVGELTGAVLGGGPARQSGTGETTFAVALTADGAALLGTALLSAAPAAGGQPAAGEQQTTGAATSGGGSASGGPTSGAATAVAAASAPPPGLALLAADFDLAVPFVLDDIVLRVWCDVASSCQSAHDLAASGELTADSLVTAVVAQHHAGTSLSSARPLSADEQTALTAIGSQLLAGLLPPALLDAGGQPVSYSAELEQRLNLTLTATYPATRHYNLTGNLALPAAGGTIETFDLTADALLRHVVVTVAGDLTGLGITAVAIHLDYNGTTEAGASVVRSADLSLLPGATTAVAGFDLATADQRTVTGRAQVHFADGSAPYAFDLPASDGDDIVLDADSLGVLVVDASLGMLDPVTAASAVIEFGYGDAISATRVLTPAAPTGRWSAVVREVPGSYRYRVSWTAGTSRIVGDWQDGSQRSLILNAPPALSPPSTTVTVLSAGDFDAVSAVIFELRPGPDGPVSVLQFNAAGQSETWTATGQPLSYQVRQSIALRSGSHVSGDWSDESRTVLLARDSLRYDVVLIARLLELGGGVDRAVVQLQGPDLAVAPSVAVLTSPDAQPVCPIRLLDPADHSYRYQLTVSPVGSPPRTSDWLTDSSSILVLRPVS